MTQEEIKAKEQKLREGWKIFFNRVFYMRERTQRYMAVCAQINEAKKHNKPTDELEQEREKLMGQVKAFTVLVDDHIKFTEKYYDDNNLEKFWR